MKPDTTIDVVFRCEHRESKKIKLERSFRNLSNDKITSNDELVAEKNVSNKFVTEKNLSDEVFIHITLDVPIPWPKDSAKWYVRECHKNYHWTLVVSSKFEGDYLLRNYPIIIH